MEESRKKKLVELKEAIETAKKERLAKDKEQYEYNHSAKDESSNSSLRENVGQGPPVQQTQAGQTPHPSG